MNRSMRRGRVRHADAAGVVTALKPGKAKITVRTANRKKAKIVVIVSY